MIPLGVGPAWGSERLLQRGLPSRTAAGPLHVGAVDHGRRVLRRHHVSPHADWLRIGLIAIVLGCTPIVHSLGPAVLAEVVPASQRGAMLAINNSVASLAGIAAPVMTRVR
jgi:hypothetical protein